MNRNELIDRCKAVIQEAYEEATEMIVAYLELHPGEQLKPLAREIDPENFEALRKRVERAAAKRKAAAGLEAGGTAPRWIDVRGRRAAKQVLREAEPEQIAELLDDPEIRQNVAAAQRVHEFRQENRTGIPRRNAPQGPSFISLVLKVNGWLDELVGMVERGEAEVPEEFSTQSLTDIGVKAMRLKELVDDVRESEGVLSRD
jgi:hypothetical protein